MQDPVPARGLASAASAAFRWWERWYWLPFVLFGAVVAFETTSVAVTRPFWHDEIYTILVSELPWRDLPRAYADGVDLQPPLNTVLTKVVHSAAGPGPIATRIVPLLSFLGCLAFVFRTVERRAGAAVGLASALLLCFTAGLRYSVEARGYSLMMFCAAASLWFWLEAAADRRRRMNLGLLSVTLAAGLWTHYFFVLVVAALIAGEVTRSVRDRRVDWPVWAAMSAAGLTWLPIVAIAAKASQQAPTFWARASLADIRPAYVFLLHEALDVTVIAAVVTGIVASRIVRGSRQKAPVVPVHESVAFLAMAALPVGGVLLGTLVTGVFSDHYALAAVVGIATGPPLLIWLLGGRKSLAILPLLALLVYRYGAEATLKWPDAAVTSPISGRSILTEELAEPAAAPVAVSGGLSFLQLWYYAAPVMRPQLIFLASPGTALQYGESDTVDRGLLALHRWSAVRVDDYESFVRSHPRFRVYAAGGGWVVQALKESGAKLHPAGRELDAILYRVEARPVPR